MKNGTSPSVPNCSNPRLLGYESESKNSAYNIFQDFFVGINLSHKTLPTAIDKLITLHYSYGNSFYLLIFIHIWIVHVDLLGLLQYRAPLSASFIFKLPIPDDVCTLINHLCGLAVAPYLAITNMDKQRKIDVSKLNLSYYCCCVLHYQQIQFW